MAALKKGAGEVCLLGCELKGKTLEICGQIKEQMPGPFLIFSADLVKQKGWNVIISPAQISLACNFALIANTKHVKIFLVEN